MAEIMHIVEKGETPLKLSYKYGITIDAFYQANPFLEREAYLYPNQVINIPDHTFIKYVIRNEESLSYISKLFNLTISELVFVNPQLNRRNQLSNGQIINIPKPKKSNIVQTSYEYGYHDLISDLKEITHKYPFVTTEVIGKSVMGKSIIAIRLGKGEKELFYSADWHANEYLTGPILMKFVEDYAKAYSNNKRLNGYDINEFFETYSIYLVPMVNPDGIELFIEGITPKHLFYEKVIAINKGLRNFQHWTANIRGVDLNHQWPADWEVENDRSPKIPSPKKYGGNKPLTEPETKAIHQFTVDHNFELILAFHSQGEEIFWGDKGKELPESKLIAKRFAELTNYQLIEIPNSSAGYRDWFVQEFNKPGYTVEVGKGMNPLPITQFDFIYSRIQNLLLEAPILIAK